MSDDPLPSALHFAAILEELRIDYWLGGSLASSVHGEPRSTHDVDFVVDMRARDVSGLVARLSPDYHVSESYVHESVSRRGSFQVVHKEGYHRIDVFVKKDEPFAHEQHRRRTRTVIDPATGRALWITSAEDIVLQKLVWYRKGDEVSDRQWRDVLGVLKANPGLDRSHLERWAGELDVSDLLSRALAHAGLVSTDE